MTQSGHSSGFPTAANLHLASSTVVNFEQIRRARYRKILVPVWWPGPMHPSPLELICVNAEILRLEFVLDVRAM
jgi:hypothetical protein